jgi:hypothetical protein
MKVEVYEVEEVAASTPDETECAQALVNKLGLTKQREFYAPDRPKARWRRVTAEEVFAFRSLCPSETTLENYRSGPIPLRVLEVIEQAQESGFFEKFVVWHPEDVRTDPVLIGRKTGSRGAWDTEDYILARWGEALDEMPALLRNAMEGAKAKTRRIIAEAQAMLSKIEAGDPSMFTGQFSPSLFFTGTR